MKLKQILIPIAIGAGIIIGIMALIEVNNALSPALGLPHMNRLNAGNIFVLSFFIGIALIALFGVLFPSDDDEKEVVV